MGVLEAVKGKAPTLSPMEAARAEVERLEASESEWAERAQGLRAQLASLATAVTDSDDAAAILARGRETAATRYALQSDLTTALSQRQVLHQRRAEAVRAVSVAEVADLRRQAAALRSEADEREKRTHKLLGEIQDFEGCLFGPVIPPGAYDVGAIPWPPLTRSQMMRNRASALEYEANQLEVHPHVLEPMEDAV